MYSSVRLHRDATLCCSYNFHSIAIVRNKVDSFLKFKHVSHSAEMLIAASNSILDFNTFSITVVHLSIPFCWWVNRFGDRQGNDKW